MPRHEAGADATSDPATPVNASLAASAATLNTGTQSIRHPAAESALPGERSGQQQDSASFLDVLKQLHVESTDEPRQLDPVQLEAQAVAHRTFPAEKQLDRTLESLPGAETPEDEVEGRLNFIQLQSLLRSDLAQQSTEKIQSVAKQMHVAEHDVRCLLYYYRVPPRPSEPV